ncbi:MAG: GNAT family N-acetyltransferase [Pacificimonas sp.]
MASDANGLKLDVRPYRAADRSGLEAVALAAFAPVYAGIMDTLPDYAAAAFYPDGWETRERRHVETMLADEDLSFLIAETDSILIGYCGLRVHIDDRMGEVHVIGVDPLHQRHGIGRALIDAALVRFRNRGLEIAMIETGADEGHASARASYEAMGFDRWDAVRYLTKL